MIYWIIYLLIIAAPFMVVFPIARLIVGIIIGAVVGLFLLSIALRTIAIHIRIRRLGHTTTYKIRRYCPYCNHRNRYTFPLLHALNVHNEEILLNQTGNPLYKMQPVGWQRHADDRITFTYNGTLRDLGTTVKCKKCNKEFILSQGKRV